MRPKIYLFGDSITEVSFADGGWAASLSNHFSRTVTPHFSLPYFANLLITRQLRIYFLSSCFLIVCLVIEFIRLMWCWKGIVGTIPGGLWRWQRGYFRRWEVVVHRLWLLRCFLVLTMLAFPIDTLPFSTCLSMNSSRTLSLSSRFSRYTHYSQYFYFILYICKLFFNISFKNAMLILSFSMWTCSPVMPLWLRNLFLRN